MMKIFILAVLAILAYAQCANYAVLVAGSNGYYNYRHQSDVCHAYQIMKKNGIPDSNIIVFMYDDIAYNSQNPKKGKIINEPNGPDVYAGVPKDYIKEEVTPANFLKLLRGEDMGMHKKSLKTGPNDNIFIFFSDHGAPGLIAFPGDKMLYAKDLIATLKYMHDNHKYNKLVFYLEACESGSMFNQILPADWDIYATTAANPFVSSYACYYDSSVSAYLDDCYSINWMNHTETHDIHTTTLEKQFQDVKRQTTQSPVCVYGDLKMGPISIAEFQAQDGMKRSRKISSSVPRSPVNARDVQLATLQRLVASTNDEQSRNKYITELEQYQRHIDAMDVAWNSLKGLMNVKEESLANGDNCYGKAVAFDCMQRMVPIAQSLGLVSEYALKHLKILNQACYINSEAQIENALRLVAKHF